MKRQEKEQLIERVQAIAALVQPDLQAEMDDEALEEAMEDLNFIASVAWNLAVLPNGMEYFEKFEQIVTAEDPLVGKEMMAKVKTMMDGKRRSYAQDDHVIVEFDMDLDTGKYEVEAVSLNEYMDSGYEEPVYDRMIEVLDVFR